MNIKLPNNIKYMPEGFYTYSTSCGIKDSSLDLSVIYSEQRCNAAALFTKSHTPGLPIIIGRKHIANGKLQAIVINSKNANVATGITGYQDTLQICKKVSHELGIHLQSVLPSSTGVIGQRLPLTKILTSLNQLKSNLSGRSSHFIDVSRAMMTTDTFPKFLSARIGDVSIVGIAKGAGMVEPNLSTMLVYFFTDAIIVSRDLKKILRKVTQQTFNCLSIDSDTSTSDTVCILANGMQGKVNLNRFYLVLLKMATRLTQWIAMNAEGATKLLIVYVKNARNNIDAHIIGKSIINSPLVKTAIYKADPNWGRIVMAIGKSSVDKIIPEKVQIHWGKDIICSEINQREIATYMETNTILELTIDMNMGHGFCKVYGCDLTEDYVRINSAYTT